MVSVLIQNIVTRKLIMANKSLVLSSGGLDSATCLAIAKEAGSELFALSFEYGQRHNIELEMAKRQAHYFGVTRHVIANIDLRAFGGSALTADIDVPKGKVDGEGIPITYVPARNLLFLSYALGWAEVLQADAIYIGVNAVDYSGYPDCRPEFIEAFRKVARLGTKGGVEGTWTPEVRTPLIDLSKGEIIRMGMAAGADYALSWSCYDPTPTRKPCGECDSCVLRARGFAQVGVPDPLLA